LAAGMTANAFALSQAASVDQNPGLNQLIRKAAPCVVVMGSDALFLAQTAHVFSQAFSPGQPFNNQSLGLIHEHGTGIHANRRYRAITGSLAGIR